MAKKQKAYLEFNLNIDKMKNWLIGALLLVIIFGGFYLIKEVKSSGKFIDESFEEEGLPDIINFEEEGLLDIIKIGDLSFQLDEVELFYVEEGTDIIGYMFWKYTIINTGWKTEYVHDCGLLIFEDGSKYEYRVDNGGKQIMVDMDNCGSRIYKISPGERVIIEYGFRFSDQSTYYASLKNARLWEDVPGSKITFFSQQNEGLVEYVVNKDEIVYDSIIYDGWEE